MNSLFQGIFLFTEDQDLSLRQQLENFNFSTGKGIQGICEYQAHISITEKSVDARMVILVTNKYGNHPMEGKIASNHIPI